MLDLVSGVSGTDDATKSDSVRPPNLGRSLNFISGCWARKASVACFINVDDESERWSISSERLRFLRMGFFDTKELLLEREFVGGVDSESKAFVTPCWRGP